MSHQYNTHQKDEFQATQIYFLPTLMGFWALYIPAIDEKPVDQDKYCGLSSTVPFTMEISKLILVGIIYPSDSEIKKNDIFSLHSFYFHFILHCVINNEPKPRLRPN